MANEGIPDMGVADAATSAAVTATAVGDASDASAASAPPSGSGWTTTRWVRVISSVVVVLAIIGGYFSLLSYFRDESDSRSASVEVGDANGAVGLDVSAWLVSVDQQQEQAVIRVNFEPKGSIADEDGTLKYPVRLFVNSANAAQDRSFEKGKGMPPVDVTVDLYDSSITKYPFDKFKATLLLSASTQMPNAQQPQEAPDPAAEPGAAPAPAVLPLETVAVPVAINFFGGLHGLKIATGDTSTEDGVTQVEFKVSRSATTLAIAWFIMMVLLAVSMVILCLTLMMTIGGRKIELPIIALCGALMFGFVAFRNTMPGTPPVGSMSDYIAFFWAEGIVAASLFALVAVYLKRTLLPPKQS